MQSSAPLQLALYQMHLGDEKFAKIPILVRLQHGKELARARHILYPCQRQVWMQRAVLGGKTERGEGNRQTLMEAP